MKSILTAILIAVILSGCAPSYSAKMETWINQPYSLLQSQWGPATAEIPIENGRTVARYNRGGYRTTPTMNFTSMMPSTQTSYFNGYTATTGSFGGTVNTTSYYPSTITIPGGTVYNWCCTDFYLNPERFISSIQWQGDCD